MEQNSAVDIDVGIEQEVHGESKDESVLIETEELGNKVEVVQSEGWSLEVNPSSFQDDMEEHL